MSERTKHTPGPWRHEVSAHQREHAAFVMPTAAGQADIGATFTGGRGEANAARIVACVNACEPGGAVAEMVKAVRELLVFQDRDDIGFSFESLLDAEEDTRTALAAVERIVRDGGA